jgi:CO dehydrogenase nickel-insertion accessory protein CooC1
MLMNTAKDLIKKLVDHIPESKAGEVIDFLLYLKNKKEQDLSYEENEENEEEELWGLIENDERISENDLKKKLIGEADE